MSIRWSAAAAAVVCAVSAAHAQDVLVLAPDEFAGAAADWVRYREGQGRKVAVRPPGADPGAVVRAVHRESGGTLRHVLLVGDVDRVPCAQRPVAATAKWEDAPYIATDAPFADVDGDDVPDLSIGRVPARSAEEARALLARSAAYEGERDVSEWRRRVNVVAGTGGFGPLQDAALEQMTKGFLTRHVPPEIVVSGTYGNALSAWCPPPAEFAATALERLDEGSLVFAYIGHGSPTELDRVRFGKEKHPIFGAAQAARVDVRRGAPLAVFIACSTGRYDGAEDSLAETLLRRPRGPVGVIASSRVSTPYSNGILAKELLDALWKSAEPTAGEVLLAMKRALVSDTPDEARKQIEGLAATFYDADPARRAADRREHLYLYNLLGDPLVRIGRPGPLPIDAPATARPGDDVTVRGTSPHAGRAIVEIARRRDAAVPLGPRKTPEDWRATYERANRQQVARVAVEVPEGAFRVNLALPADAAPGPYCVRVFIEGKEACAAGGRPLDVHAAAPAGRDPPASGPEKGR